MLRLTICFVVFLVLGYAEKQDSQKPLTDSPSSPFDAEFDKLVQDSLKHLHLPGLSIAIVDGNQTHAKVVPPVLDDAHRHCPTEDLLSERVMGLHASLMW